jgi:hypothetical protein
MPSALARGLKSVPWVSTWTPPPVGFSSSPFGFDLVSKKIILSNATSSQRIELKATPYGLGTGARADDAFGAVYDALATTESFTYGCVLFATANPTAASNGRAIARGTRHLFGINSSGMPLFDSYCAGEAGSTNKWTSSVPITLGSANTLVYAHGSGTSQYAMLNGQTIATTTETRALVASSTGHVGGCAPYQSSTPAVVMLAFFWWGRKITEAEAAAFCADPYQFLVPA